MKFTMPLVPVDVGVPVPRRSNQVSMVNVAEFRPGAAPKSTNASVPFSCSARPGSVEVVLVLVLVVDVEVVKVVLVLVVDVEVLELVLVDVVLVDELVLVLVLVDVVAPGAVLEVVLVELLVVVEVLVDVVVEGQVGVWTQVPVPSHVSEVHASKSVRHAVPAGVRNIASP